MKIYNEFVAVQTKQRREFMDLTPHVKAGLEKAGMRDGFAIVMPLHANSAVFVNDAEAGLLADIEEWIGKLAPPRDDYQHPARSESNASAHLQAILLNPQVVVPFSEGRLDLGPWQHVVYAELDGARPKRILIKFVGE